MVARKFNEMGYSLFTQFCVWLWLLSRPLQSVVLSSCACFVSIPAARWTKSADAT